MTIQEQAKEFASDYSRSEQSLVAHAYHCGAVDYINKACNLWKKHILKADITAEEFEQLLKNE